MLFAAAGRAHRGRRPRRRRRRRDHRDASTRPAAAGCAVHADVSRRADCDAMVAGHDRRTSAASTSSTTTRRCRCRGGSSTRPRTTGTSPSRRTSTRCSGRAGPRCPTWSRRGNAQHHQHRVGARPHRLRGLRRVRRREGRARRADAPDRHGVRARRCAANVIAPGSIDTPRFRKVAETMPDPSFLAGLEQTIPLHRLGTAEDVAGIALFLASDLSAYTTGAVDPRRRWAGGVPMSRPRVGKLAVVTGGGVRARRRGRAAARGGGRAPSSSPTSTRTTPQPRRRRDRRRRRRRRARPSSTSPTRARSPRCSRRSSSSTAGSTCSSAARRSRPGRRSLDTTDEAWRRVLDVNLKGPFLCMKHGLPPMVEHRRRLGDPARLGARRDRLARGTRRTARRRARS